MLACDGIWDVMSNNDVIDFCRTRIGKGMYPEEICEELMNNCLAPDCQMGGLGGDNMTVVLVCFLHNKPYDDLVKRCSPDRITITVIKNELLDESAPCKLEEVFLIKDENVDKEVKIIITTQDPPTEDEFNAEAMDDAE